jgi:quinoprotein glucose dehydrogenase
VARGCVQESRRRSQLERVHDRRAERDRIIPFGTARFDFFGGDRVGDNLFANSLVALDARTGKRLWHYQLVHHDLWDYDLPQAPKLLTLKQNGRNIDVVAQASKFGFIYVFERKTGKPVFPIEERPVPQTMCPAR